MDDIRSAKHRKRYRREKSNGKRERPPAKPSSRNAPVSVLSCLSNTEKSFEKQIPRRQLTQGRITTRPGLFNQGKCTSFVHRALCFSPTKKARMDEDLHRIIQLANGIPDEDPKYLSVSERHANVGCCGISQSSCSRTESVEVCEESSHACEDILWGDIQNNTGNEKHAPSLSTCCEKLKHSTSSGHRKMETDSRKERSPEERKGYALSNASNASNDSPCGSSVKYSSPLLAEYEKFSAAAILPLNSKKELLFPGKDYLKEVRGRIKTIVHQKKNIHRLNTIHAANILDAAIQEDRTPFEGGDSLLNAQSMKSPMGGQRNGTESQMSPPRKQHDFDDFSPFPCILSPKTTILNPIEYLRRVEQAHKQKERTFCDSGHESGQSHGSSLSKSQGETNFPHDLQKSDSLQFSLEPNECCAQQPQNTADSLLYQHSNRSFIDSPQAFKIRDGNFEFPGSHCAYTSFNSHHYDDLDARLKQKPCQRTSSVLNAEHDVSGLQYLMDIAEIGHSSDNLHNPSDLLDELDALACDTADDSSVFPRRDLRKPASSAKRWGPPPSPPTPEHKFYRRKMF